MKGSTASTESKFAGYLLEAKELEEAEILDFIMFRTDKRPYALICDPITYTKTGYVEAVIRRFCIVRREFVGPRLLINSRNPTWFFISDQKVSEMMGVSEKSFNEYWKGERQGESL